MSKFRNLVNTKQIAGDNEDDPDFGDPDDNFQFEEKKLPEEEP